MDLSLIPDTPIAKNGQDKIGFGEYVAKVGSLIRQLEYTDSCSIGIYADWGRGKTSFINLLQDHLQKTDPDSVICVYYQAWRFDSQAYPMESLVATLLDEVSDKISESAVKYLKAVLASLEFQAGFNAFGNKASAKVKGKDLVDRLERDGARKEKAPPSFTQFKQVSKIHDDAVQKKVVIFIDDLDRCQPDIAVRFLEGIKQIFDCPGYVIVMGLNRDILNKFIIQRFESLGVPDISIDRYLEKLFKIEFELVKTTHPDVDKLICYLFGEYINKYFSDDCSFDSLKEIIRTASRENPRAAIKLINKLILGLNLTLDAPETTEEKVSISREDFVRIEKNCFEDCLAYVSPAIFKELGQSSISRDLYITLLYGTDYPDPYLVDFLISFAGEKEVEAAVALLSLQVGKRWVGEKIGSEYVGDKTFLLKQGNLTDQKSQQYLIDIASIYLKPQSFIAKVEGNEIGRELSRFFSEDYTLVQLQGILSCLLKTKHIDEIVSFYVDFTRRILITYVGEDVYLMSRTNLIPAERKAHLDIFNRCLMLLKKVINLSNNDLTIRALLIYSAIFERVSTSFYLDDSRYLASDNVDNTDRIVRDFLKKCGSTVKNREFFTCEALKEAAAEGGYPASTLGVREFRQIYSSRYNDAQDKMKEKYSAFLVFLESTYQKLVWDNLESTNLVQLLINMTSIASLPQGDLQKATYFQTILNALIEPHPVLKATYQPQLDDLHKKREKQLTAAKDEEQSPAAAHMDYTVPSLE